jgi:hypothetical protein
VDLLGVKPKAVSRGKRIGKYKRLLEIERQRGAAADKRSSKTLAEIPPRRHRPLRLGAVDRGDCRRPRVVEPRTLREAVALALLRDPRLRAAHLVGARRGRDRFARFLERHEDDALGGAGPLAHQHEAADRHALTVPGRGSCTKSLAPTDGQ